MSLTKEEIKNLTFLEKREKVRKLNKYYENLFFPITIIILIIILFGSFIYMMLFMFNSTPDYYLIPEEVRLQSLFNSIISFIVSFLFLLFIGHFLEKDEFNIDLYMEDCDSIEVLNTTSKNKRIDKKNKYDFESISLLFEKKYNIVLEKLEKTSIPIEYNGNELNIYYFIEDNKIIFFV